MTTENIENAITGREDESDIIIRQETHHDTDESHIADNAHPDSIHHEGIHDHDEHDVEDGHGHDEGHGHGIDGDQKEERNINMKNAGTIVTLLLIGIIGIVPNIKAKAIDQIIESDIYDCIIITSSIDNIEKTGVIGESDAIERAKINRDISDIGIINNDIAGRIVKEIGGKIIRIDSKVPSIIKRVDTIGDDINIGTNIVA